MQLTRWEIIQKLIDTHGYKRYLEIGVNKSRTFDRINVESKTGVDPNIMTTYTMTSDAFFEVYDGPGFDLIFIDGNHFGDYAYRDAQNAFGVLNEGGTIVMHDCRPANELTQVRPDHPLRKQKKVVAWNGTVWRAWLRLKADRNVTLTHEMFVIDTDHGVGIIRDGRTGLCDPSYCLMSYRDFEKNMKEYLNLIPVEDFKP